jgi:hypothetical protein
VLLGCGRRPPTSIDLATTSTAGNHPEINSTRTEVAMTTTIELDEAWAHTRDFEKTHDPEALRAGYEALESVSLQGRHDPEARRALRAEALGLWLHMLALLDQLIDPRFDPKDVPGRRVQPPPGKDGIVFPPGVEPERIDDPAARAQYQAAIAANDAKIEHYRLQVELRRLDERITPRAETFVREAYSSDPRDQAELRAAIDKTITHPPRKATLSKLLAPSRP